MAFLLNKNKSLDASINNVKEDADNVYLNMNTSKPSTFTGRSVENGLPVTNPLYNLEEVLAWVPNDLADFGQMFCVANVPYQMKLRDSTAPKTLVCHDMKGGYIMDRFAQGCTLNDTDDNWYNFTHWDCVDTFVYFSHHFVTIPPVGWINAAHRNGVAMLGTVITEGADGELRWKAILSCSNIWEIFAEKLVAIAKFYAFEGWLLNVENKINKEDISKLTLFVQYLHKLMKGYSENAQVIWYDSVTSDGKLAWQNELNQHNSFFFDACDGIFLNYFWTPENIANSALAAGDRTCDVYVGIDVFGRSTYGGGGFNSCKALEVIQKNNLSTAIFAPGWVKEVLGEESFEKNQQRFWNLLGTKLPNYPVKSQGFATNFNPGITQKALRKFSLSDQDFLPRLSDGNKIVCLTEGVEVLKMSSVLYSVYVAVEAGKQIHIHLNYPKTLDLKVCKEDGEVTTFGLSRIKSECTSGDGEPYELYEYVYPGRDNAPAFEVYEIISRGIGNLDSLKVHVDGNVAKTEQVETTSMTLEHVSWSKKDVSLLAMSLVLSFDDFKSGIDFVIISYACVCDLDVDPITSKPLAFPASKTRKMAAEHLLEIGRSHCSKFRVNQLTVPNPMFYAPCAVIFRATMFDEMHKLVARSDLIVEYEENMRS